MCSTPLLAPALARSPTDSAADFSANGAGSAAQALAAIELRLRNVDLYVHHKKLSATAKDADGEKLDAGGEGFSAGLNLAFGP